MVPTADTATTLGARAHARSQAGAHVVSQPTIPASAAVDLPDGVASDDVIFEETLGAGAYNVEPSPDGRWVIVTNKKAQSFSLVDAATLTEAARVPTTKKIVHGVAWSPDGAYAFISQESIGADSGAVYMFDLAARKTIATIGVPAQPTGIAIHVLRP